MPAREPQARQRPAMGARAAAPRSRAAESDPAGAVPIRFARLGRPTRGCPTRRPGPNGRSRPAGRARVESTGRPGSTAGRKEVEPGTLDSAEPPANGVSVDGVRLDYLSSPVGRGPSLLRFPAVAEAPFGWY